MRKPGKQEFHVPVCLGSLFEGKLFYTLRRCEKIINADLYGRHSVAAQGSCKFRAGAESSPCKNLIFSQLLIFRGGKMQVRGSNPGTTAGFKAAIWFVIIFSWAFQAQAQPTKESLTKKNRAAAVAIVIIYLNPMEQIEKGKLAFEVSLNTHTVDLDPYAIEKLSFLRDDKGNEIKAMAWDKRRGSGHRRFGTLVFSDTDSTGEAFIKPETKFIELIIQDIAGEKERVFHWDLPIN